MNKNLFFDRLHKCYKIQNHYYPNAFLFKFLIRNMLLFTILYMIIFRIVISLFFESILFFVIFKKQKINNFQERECKIYNTNWLQNLRFKIFSKFALLSIFCKRKSIFLNLRRRNWNVKSVRSF